VSVEVRLKIDARTAIRARKTTVGLVAVAVTDDDLKDMPGPVLEMLAEVVTSGEVLEGPHVEDASISSVLSGLAARQARIEEAKAADVRAGLEARAGEARAAEEGIVRRREAEAAVARHADAITRWIEENCDDDMIERRRDGFLKDDEILEEVMHQILDIPEDEHVRIQPHEACDCDKGCAGSVRMTVLPVDHLDSSQHATLRRIRDAAPQGAEVIPQMRKGACPECSCAPLVRMTALVRLPWNGWMLQKAYSLG
jgi:hypothetical protein